MRKHSKYDIHTHVNKNRFKHPLSKLQNDWHATEQRQTSKFFRKITQQSFGEKTRLLVNNDNAPTHVIKPYSRLKIVSVFLIAASIFFGANTMTISNHVAFYDQYDMKTMMKKNPDALAVMLNAIQVGQ